MKTNKPLANKSTPTLQSGCISYQSYLDAIRIVKQYHAQVEEECQIENYRFLSLQDWAKSHQTMSVRLKNIIKYYAPEVRVCDLTIAEFKRLRGVGQQRVDEYKSLILSEQLKKSH